MDKTRTPLDLYDYELTPPAMKAYLRNYGFNFSKKACEYAVSLMEKINTATGMPEKRLPIWSERWRETSIRASSICCVMDVAEVNIKSTDTRGTLYLLKTQ